LEIKIQKCDFVYQQQKIKQQIFSISVNHLIWFNMNLICTVLFCFKDLHYKIIMKKYVFQKGRFLGLLDKIVWKFFLQTSLFGSVLKQKMGLSHM